MPLAQNTSPHTDFLLLILHVHTKDPYAKFWKNFFLAVGSGFLTDSINSHFGSVRNAPRSVTW